MVAAILGINRFRCATTGRLEACNHVVPTLVSQIRRQVPAVSGGVVDTNATLRPLEEASTGRPKVTSEGAKGLRRHHLKMKRLEARAVYAVPPLEHPHEGFQIVTQQVIALRHVGLVKVR